MAKNILAFFGLIFLTLLILSGVGIMGTIYNEIGLIALPVDIASIAESFSGTVTVVVAEGGSEDGSWSNPLDLAAVDYAYPAAVTPAPYPTQTPEIPLADSEAPREVIMPDPTAAPVIIPTNTPLPPLDPGVYQTEVILGLKRFVAAIENWLALNDRLARGEAAVDDANWRAEIEQALNETANAGQALADIGPAPEVYSEMDALLEPPAAEAAALQINYLQALATGDTAYFNTAGENFSRMKAYLAQAAEAMLNAGWNMQ